MGLEGVGHKPPKIAGKISGVTYIMGWKQNKTKQNKKPIDFPKKKNKEELFFTFSQNDLLYPWFQQ